MWGLLGLDAKKAEEEDEDDPDLDLDTDFDSVVRARIQEEGVQLPPLAGFYEKDRNKEEQISTFVQQYTVLLEFQRMLDCLPSGMYVSPSFTSILQWHGVIFVRSGLYRGGIFKFQLDLPEEYPELPPSLYFLTDIFHPMVEPTTGRVDLDVWFTDWKAGSDFAACALPRLHKALVQKDHIIGRNDAVEPLNMEARDLFVNDPAAFAERVKECVEASNSSSSCFDNPEGALLRFAEGPKQNHEDLLKALRETDLPSSSFEDRKSMFVEWFCDHYVRHAIIGKGRKKKKKKRKFGKDDKTRDRRPTGGDLASLKKFADMLAQESEEEEDDDEEPEEEEDDVSYEQLEGMEL